MEPRPARPPNRKRKLKEPLFEEDIVDGFAIYSFKAYSDIEVRYITLLAVIFLLK